MVTRRFAGIWGVISFTIMVIVVIIFLVKLELPPVIIWGGGLLVGGLLLLQIIASFRGMARRTQHFSTFEHNKLGDPVIEEFQPPYDRALPFNQEESVLTSIGPVMRVMTGLGDFLKSDWGILGKGTVTNAENALILTQKRLLLLMLGPTDLKQFSSSPKITSLLESLPGDAYAKRQMLWQTGAREVQEALAGILKKKNLQQLSEDLYSFTIPLSDITSVEHSLQNRSLTIQLKDLRLRYAVKTKEALVQLMDELDRLEISVNDRRN